MMPVFDPETGETTDPSPIVPRVTAPKAPTITDFTPMENRVVSNYDMLCSHFPFSEVRPAQERAMHGWVNATAKGKSFAIFELPTGSGKSGLAWAFAEAANNGNIGDFRSGAYILTTQKTLQDQYMRDFESRGLMQVMGASNYLCGDFPGKNCQEGSLIRKTMEKKAAAAALEGAKDQVDKPHCQFCSYRDAKGKFGGAPVGITNFAYFLAEAKYIHQLKPRNVLIIDEAHNTESQILSQVEIEITQARCDEFECKYPSNIPEGDVLAARKWVLDVFLPTVDAMMVGLEESIRRKPYNCEQPLKQLARCILLRGRLIGLDDPNQLHDWFCNLDAKGTLKLRPLTAERFAHDSLFFMGRQVAFLSATILDPQAFSRGLGLSTAQGGFCQVDSDFPVANRPIHYYPLGAMSYKKKGATIPRMLKFIERILAKHPDEKGIVHTQSYALTKTIKDYLDGTPHAKRIVMPEGAQQRKAGLALHHASDEPTVLLSPSMTEGLDLYGDLSRFQVLPKVPYPSLGDPFIKARMAHDESWYSWQTGLSIVQATGRSVRSKEDHAVTYILDSDFSTFMARSAGILPQWWKDAIVYH